MSFQVKINGVDKTPLVIGGPYIHKNDIWLGKISPNECSFYLDNTNLAYKISNLDDLDGQTVEIWINGTKQFIGYAEKPTLTRNDRTVHIQAYDKMKKLQKLKCADKIFINSTIDSILVWLVETIGGIGAGERNLDSLKIPTSSGVTEAVTGYALYSIKDKLTDRLQEIVDSCGGMMWFDESGILQFRAGFAADWSTSTVGTITVSKLEDISSLQWLPSEGDRVIVKSRNRSAKAEKEPVFIWSGTVPVEGLPTGKDENGNPITDDKWEARFDNPAIDIDDYTTVNAAKEFDSGLSLNESVYNSNFSGGKLKYPDFMYLQIDNSSGYEKNVTKLLINGKPIVENYLEVVHDAGSFEVEREISNDLISSKVWASCLAKWLYENGNEKFEAVVPLADFTLGTTWKVGNKINIVDTSTGLSHRAWIREIDIDYGNRSMTVRVRSDRNSAFEYTAPGNTTTGPGTNLPPATGDTLPPAVPTGLTLTTFSTKDRNYVKATWNANTEADLIGYEIRWGYDGSNWYNAGFCNNNELVIEVTTRYVQGISYTVYVQVRAVDIENLRSDWCAAASKTIQYDTAAPSIPGSISATGGVGLIYVDWSAVYESDLSHYMLQRCVQVSSGGPWSSWTYIATLKSSEFIDESVEYHIQNSPEDPLYPNQWRKYRYRVVAVDFAGNGSSWREIPPASAAYASQATGPDIAVKSIKANHLEVAIDLAVGRMVKVGSNIQIGADVGPAGSTFDGIYVTDGTNYVKMSASFIKLKADLILGQGDNEIYFEDAGIHLKDAGFGAEGGRLQYFGNTPEDTGETQKVFYDLLYHKDSSGNLDWSNLLLRTDISNKYCTIKMEARNGTNYYEKMGLISTILAKSTTGSIYPEIQFRIYSNDEGYITASHPFKLPTYDLNTSLPTLPCGCIALKELTTGNFWLVWSDGSRWFAPDGRTLLA